MPCYEPQPLYRTPKGWRFAPKTGDRIPGLLPLYVGCKKCIGCRLEYSRQWAVRSVHEAQFHEDNWFFTLTFNEKFIPKDLSLDTKTIQGFWKRLRKARPSEKFKYYAAGEYGDEKNRPHYHASVFGLSLPDLYSTFKSSEGYQMFSSTAIERAWSDFGDVFGNVYIAPLTFETAAYTARYIVKKITGKKSKEHYDALGVIPERSWISKGLGKEWYETYADETYRDGYIVSRGVPAGIPQTYSRWLKRDDPAKHDRFLKSIEKSYDEQLKVIEDLVDGRHVVAKAVKEACLRAGKLDFQR